MCLESLDFLVFFLFLTVLLLQDKDVQIPGGVIGTKKPQDLLHHLLFRCSVLQKQIFDILFELVVSRVNAQVVHLLLCLGQVSHVS